MRSNFKDHILFCFLKRLCRVISNFNTDTSVLASLQKDLQFIDASFCVRPDKSVFKKRLPCIAVTNYRSESGHCLVNGSRYICF